MKSVHEERSIQKKIILIRLKFDTR
jgi:hypothetical protein